MAQAWSFQYVHTDKDLHFTEQLLPNASEYEDIVVTGTGPMPSYVESLRLWSTQNLPWLVAFHRTDNTTPGLTARATMTRTRSLISGPSRWGTGSRSPAATSTR